MAGRDNLGAASKAKKDEFYTQLTDIEKELRHYRQHFKDKVVFCNCDDPFESDFFKYFVLQFNRLGLKKLICTCYAGSPVMGKQLSHFDIEPEAKPGTPYKAIVTSVRDVTGDGGIGMDDIAELFHMGENSLTELAGNGDFRSEECLELLDEADIVVTNPPFSLFREYVATLMEHDKKFIIIGNVNAITYKEFFPLLMNNQVWIGYRFNKRENGKNMTFRVPDNYPLKGTEVYQKDGVNYISVAGTGWFTNLDIKKRHEEMILVKRYSPDDYPHYDNYDAINVDKTVDIPCDWPGVMGVPITFLDKYSLDQFEIVGLGNSRDNFTPTKDYINPKKHLKDGRIVNGGAINCVLAIEYDSPPDGAIYYTSENSKVLIPPYARILIRNKHPETPKEH